MRIGCVLVIGVVACSFLSAEVIRLADEGRPLATIVVQKEADELVLDAAEDLRHYVQAVCGVELPLKEDGAAVAGAGIYIGRCAPTRDQDLPPAESNPETFAIGVRDGNLFLAGRHAAATAFAVVSFVEDDLGVRWFAPGDLWEYVPKGTPGGLTADVTNRDVVPDWSPRVWSGHGWVASWRQWCLRNKAICVPPVPFRNMQNYLHKIFAPEKYAASHPEYYPLINGERWIPPEGNRAWRPCESNPEVVQITVEAAREYLDAHPEHNSFSLAMDDIYRLCGCDACRAMDASPEDYKKRRFSDRHYKFVNAVARELAKTHPDKFIGTLCYHIARELPETVDKLEPNVFISMTQCVAEWWRPGRREEDLALTREWRKRCAHMSRYDYMGLGFLTPRVFPHAMAEGMKFDHSLGFEGVYNECYTLLPNTAPMMWMIAKLQWDTARDTEALLDEFYERMFGDAAATMKHYYALLERSWMTPRDGRLGWGHRDLRTQSRAMAVEDVAAAERLLEQAQGESDDPKVLQRIDVVAAGLRYAAYVIRAQALAQDIRASEVTSPDAALATVERLAELTRLSEERERFWAEAMTRDDILGETLRGLSSKRYFVASQIASVEARASSALLKALSVLHAHAPGQAAAAVERFAGANAGYFTELAQAWAATAGGEQRNLLRNPGFEKTGSNRGKAEADWETAGAPPGWSRWDNGVGAPRFFCESGEGRSDTTAAGIAGGSSACYLQKVDVRPGQRYLCLLWVKQGHPDEDGVASLGVRWQTSADEWHPRSDLESKVDLPEPGPDWQLLALATTVPDGAGRLVFMLSAKYQKPGVRVLFDDAALYLLPNG